MDAAGLLMLENPIKINSDGEEMDQAIDESIEECEEDLDVIHSALDLEPGDEDDEEEEDLTERERGEKIIDILIPPFEWQDEQDCRWIQRIEECEEDLDVIHSALDLEPGDEVSSESRHKYYLAHIPAALTVAETTCLH
nr:uncharacterized protein LOC128700630 [Cherax quadricarinatus]